MKLTFITTVYNRMDYLRNIVKCLMSQSLKIDELIIADDGSSESIMKYIGDLIKKCPFIIKHVYQEDLGFRLARSRNNAAREAEEGLLIFCDQDVVFGRTFIEEIATSSKKGTIMPIKVLWSTSEERTKIQNILDCKFPYKEAINCISSEQIEDRKKQVSRDSLRSFKYRFRLRRKPITVGGASFALYKTDYLKVNGFDELFEGHGNEDLDFGYRLQKSKVYPKIIKFSEPPIHMAHPKDPSAGSNTDKIKKIKNLSEEVKLYCDYGYNNRYRKDQYKVNIMK